LAVSAGDDGRVLLRCLAGCDTARVVSALGLTMKDLFAPKGNGNGKAAMGKIVATYPYTDAAGTLLYEVVRFEPKDFRQRRPDGSGGWIWKMEGVPRVLYHLPELVAADPATPIFIVEGEKDVDNLRAVGCLATCNSGGAGKWNKIEDTSVLHGRNVVVIPDRDEPGRKHATEVAAALRGKATAVRILELQGDGVKDVSDWIELRDTRTAEEIRDELLALRPGANQHTEVSSNELTSTQASAAKALTQTETESAIDVLILDPADPMPSAREFIAQHHTTDGTQTIIAWSGTFYTYRGTHYAEYSDDGLRSDLYRFLEPAQTWHRKLLVPYMPTSRKVEDVLQAAAALAYAGNIHPPVWLQEQDDDPAPRDLIPCSNGLLHLPSMMLYPSSPRLFTTHAIDVAFDPDATAEPRGWLAFLNQLWPDDPESVAMLQEWLGYIIGGDARLQKIMLLVGPKRSGKGTIARVLRSLLGDEQVAAPTLAGLQTNFGLQCLLNRSLAIVGDARLSGRADQQAVVERLLSISGQDAITIDRKHRDPITVQLGARFMLLSNELPRLSDASGALASRFVVLRLTESWIGREDTALFDRLKLELPAILRWSIDGWRRLQARGRFVQPASAAEAIGDLEDLSSPVSAFLRDRCEIGDAYEASRESLYEAWRQWCEGQGREHASTKATFGRDLRAAVPRIKTTMPRDAAGVQRRMYQGVGLKWIG
jgi:putative DNA primase/helicase